MSSGTKKKSLNDQILEFLQPAPKEVDPEADLAHAVTHDSFDEENVDATATPSASGRLLLRPEIALGEKYAGRKISRKALSDDIESASSAVSSDDHQRGNDDEIDDLAAEPENEDQEAKEDDVEDDEEEEGSSEEIDESASSSVSQLRPKTLDEADKLQKELDSILAQETATLVNLTPSQKELAKAKHARNQRILYSDFLEMRIRLQKSVNIANKLPHPFEHKLFASSNSDVKAKFTEVAASIRELLGDMCEMQSELLIQNPSLSAGVEDGQKLKKKKRDDNDEPGKPENEENGVESEQFTALEAAPRKRLKLDAPVDQLWKTVNAVQQGLEQQSDPILDKWNAKVHLTAGLANKKFKALNTSVVSQIKQGLTTDNEKLITRTQQKRNQYRVLGTPLPPLSASNGTQTKKSVATNGPDFDAEIFDDLDFYQQLLKDLLDYSVDEKDPSAMTKKWLASKNATTKQHRANVDRKASKGRKIKYVVHDKLVNFMTPVPLDRPAMADELFFKLLQS